MIPEEKIAEIRERTDIVALIGEYVPLKRRGGNFLGLCPFHAEKTPSFNVHPQRQFFHCFGCQASGDVFAFLSRLEGRPFPEVAQLLADRAGIELPVTDPREDVERKRRRERETRLADAMDAAAGFYVKQLAEHPLAPMAREELSRRGMRDGVVEAFRLGYAPHGWDSLSKWLRDRGHAMGDAEQLGLVVPRKSGDGHYDRFRHRLMFPVSDAHGRIIAFSGRRLDPPPDEPLREAGEGAAKYVNSPEGPLYKKGDVLFGLHEARVAIRREGWALLCEGNFDLLALHQAGFVQVVAPLGTALTEKQAKLLKRFTERVVLVLDGDAAGRKAVRSAHPILQKAGMSVTVVNLPEGMDPDSYVRERGVDALRGAVDSAPGIVEHLIDQAAAEVGADARSKATAIAELGPILARLDNPVEARLYVERVARKFGVSDVEAVRQQLRRGARGGGAAPERQNQMPTTASNAGRKALPQLQCELVGVLLDHPTLFNDDGEKSLEELLTSDDLQSILSAAAQLFRSRGVVDASALLETVGDNDARKWLEERLAIQKYDQDEAVQVLRDGVPRLARQNIEGALPRMMQGILEARRRGDDEQADELTRERDQLYTSSKRLMQATKR